MAEVERIIPATPKYFMNRRLNRISRQRPTDEINMGWKFDFMARTSVDPTATRRQKGISGAPRSSVFWSRKTSW
jgi:hypothetical protein